MRSHGLRVLRTAATRRRAASVSSLVAENCFDRLIAKRRSGHQDEATRPPGGNPELVQEMLGKRLALRSPYNFFRMTTCSMCLSKALDSGWHPAHV